MAETPPGTPLNASLTPKQARFVEEYLCDLNATQAAIRAGYSARAAKQRGAQLLARPTIADAVAQRQTARAERVQVDQDYVIGKLRMVVDRCTTPATFDGKAATSALGLLARHLGMLKDRIEHTGDAGGPIALTVTHRIIDPAA